MCVDAAGDFVTKKDLEAALKGAGVPFRSRQPRKRIEDIFSHAGVVSKPDHCAGGVKFASVWMGLQWVRQNFQGFRVTTPLTRWTYLINHLYCLSFINDKLNKWPVGEGLKT